MKYVSEHYTLNSLADALRYGFEHGKCLSCFLRYHTKLFDYFVTNCNGSSEIWWVIVAARPYTGFPIAGHRLVILGTWLSVYDYIQRAGRRTVCLPSCPDSGDGCPF